MLRIQIIQEAHRIALEILYSLITEHRFYKAQKSIIQLTTVVVINWRIVSWRIVSWRIQNQLSHITQQSSLVQTNLGHAPVYNR
jgi:hypothetical protein